jgi:hypothetical protein
VINQAKQNDTGMVDFIFGSGDVPIGRAATKHKEIELPLDRNRFGLASVCPVVTGWRITFPTSRHLNIQTMEGTCQIMRRASALVSKSADPPPEGIARLRWTGKVTT